MHRTLNGHPSHMMTSTQCPLYISLLNHTAILQEWNVCCHRQCPACDERLLFYMDSRYMIECSPDKVHSEYDAGRVPRCDDGVAACQLSKQTNRSDVYQAQWWRYLAYIITIWYNTLSTALWQHALIGVTLMVTAAAITAGTLMVRPTLRNRMLQLYQLCKARARGVITAIRLGYNIRHQYLSIPLPFWLAVHVHMWAQLVVQRACSYAQNYIIRREHMYRHPMTTILLIQSIVDLWSHHQLHFWSTAKALAAVIVFYLALYKLSTDAQLALDKRKDDRSMIEEVTLVIAHAWWQFLVYDLMYLIIEGIFIVVIVCRGLVTVTIAAVCTATKFTYNKCQAAAYEAIRAAVKHTLARLHKTEYAYTSTIVVACAQCRESLAIAVNVPCGHTFLCWTCAKQYRDEHEQVSGHALFCIKQCGHQVCVADAVSYVKAMLRDASALITHDGIKCPSYDCESFITMHDIQRLTANSYGPDMLTIAERNKIDIFIQDAQLTHGVPVGEIVYCSAPKCGRPNILNIAGTRNNLAQESTETHNAKHTMISVGCEHGHSFCNNQQVSENLQQRGGQHGSEIVYYDRRCGCAFCTDCKPSTPCSTCDGYCAVCQGVVRWVVPAATNNNNNRNTR
eukprot:17459-Heterococcus_DN1.PRE.6